MSSKRKIICLAVKSTVANDRYRKAIAIQEDARTQKNLSRAVAAGGALGYLLRRRIPASGAAAVLGGMGAGAAAQIGVRLTSKKDQFGDVPLESKKAESLPWKIGAIGAAGVAGHAALRKVKRFSARGRIIKFDFLDHQSIDTAEDLHKKWKRANRDNSRAARFAEDTYRKIGRGKRLAQDVSARVRGVKNVDDRGRERKSELTKPWVQKVVGTAVLGAVALRARKGFKNLVREANVQRDQNVSTGLPGAFNAVRNMMKKPEPGVRSGFHKVIRANRGVSRTILRARREVRAVKRDLGNFANDKFDDVVRSTFGTTKASQEATTAYKTTKAIRDKNEAVRSRIGGIIGMNPRQPGVTVPTLTPLRDPKKPKNFSSRIRIISLAVDPDWSLRSQYGNAVLVAPPGTQRRNRRRKDELGKETIDQERRRHRIEKGIGVATSLAGGGSVAYVASRMTPSAIKERAHAEASKNFLEGGSKLTVVDGGRGAAESKLTKTVTAQELRRKRGEIAKAASKLGKIIKHAG